MVYIIFYKNNIILLQKDLRFTSKSGGDIFIRNINMGLATHHQHNPTKITNLSNYKMKT